MEHVDLPSNGGQAGLGGIFCAAINSGGDLGAMKKDEGERDH